VDWRGTLGESKRGSKHTIKEKKLGKRKKESYFFVGNNYKKPTNSGSKAAKCQGEFLGKRERRSAGPTPTSEVGGEGKGR